MTAIPEDPLNPPGLSLFRRGFIKQFPDHEWRKIGAFRAGAARTTGGFGNGLLDINAVPDRLYPDCMFIVCAFTFNTVYQYKSIKSHRKLPSHGLVYD
jgi:hypothetical protein